MSFIINVDKIRKDNLKRYIAEQSYKSLTQFAKQHGLLVSNLSPILNGKKIFTDKWARKLESLLGLANGYLDRVNFDDDENIQIAVKLIENNDNKEALNNKNTYLNIDKKVINKEFNVYSLFAIKSSYFEKQLNSINEHSDLIFTTENVDLEPEKIFLLKYLDHIIVRKYTADGFFETDNKLYSKISVPSEDVQIIAKLVYQSTLIEM